MWLRPCEVKQPCSVIHCRGEVEWGKIPRFILMEMILSCCDKELIKGKRRNIDGRTYTGLCTGDVCEEPSIRPGEVTTHE